MKQFFKFMFASMLGFILGSIVLFFIMLAIVSGMMLAFKGDNEENNKLVNFNLELNTINNFCPKCKNFTFDFTIKFFTD